MHSLLSTQKANSLIIFLYFLLFYYINIKDIRDPLLKVGFICKMGKFVSTGAVLVLMCLLKSKELTNSNDPSAIHFFSAIFSVVLGFLSGKVYVRVLHDRQIHSLPRASNADKIQINIDKYLVNGAYATNFVEIENTDDDIYRVEHILENRHYHITKIRFSTFRLEDIFSFVH